MNPEAFDQLWRQYTHVKFGVDEEEHCIYAQHFAVWAEALYQDAVKQPTPVDVNQKMLLLLKKYFEWRTAVPKAHKDRIGERGHVCIFHIFERTYQRLKVLDLSLTPPLLFLPSPPSPAPQLAMLSFGEFVEEEQV